jgi:alkane 1-monooxygenase
MWRDYKYLLAYILPVATWWQTGQSGWLTWTTVVLSFGILPVLDALLPYSTANVDESEEEMRASRPLFDVLLYLHVPFLYWLIYLVLVRLTGDAGLTVGEKAGLLAGVGIMIGTMGINIAHELGHRTKLYEQILAWMLLTPALYLHFFVEHNRGHHKYVATPQDPATARLGEPVYIFWWRSIAMSYAGAWRLEKQRIGRMWSVNNYMIWFTLAQMGWLAVVGWSFGWVGVGLAVIMAVIGVLLLESVNYIEHYGLVRRQLSSGRYEPVLPAHSWNSNHEMGRIMLFELTRHADHHYKATRKYQILRHIDESPQLPLGYPASILMAMIPPLWHRYMKPRAQSWNMQRAAG